MAFDLTLPPERSAAWEDDVQLIRAALLDVEAELDTPTHTHGGGSSTWTAWTPTWSGLTIGNAVQVCEYLDDGYFIDWRLKVTFGTTSSGYASFGFTLPSAPHSSEWWHRIGEGKLYDNDSGDQAFIIVEGPNSGSEVVPYMVQKSAYGDFHDVASIGATAPWTWDDPDRIYLAGRYRKA